jgi:hypothetical protein
VFVIIRMPRYYVALDSLGFVGSFSSLELARQQTVERFTSQRFVMHPLDDPSETESAVPKTEPAPFETESAVPKTEPATPETAPADSEEKKYLWAAMFRDIDAPIAVSSSREAAQAVQDEYAALGLAYEESVDYARHVLDVIPDVVEKRLCATEWAHKEYVQ